MRLLVLGGTQFVGHAAVAEGLARGWDVTVANRGVSGPAQTGARAVTLDRTLPRAFDGLAEEHFDVVLDTWSQAPSVVRDAARALATSTDRWVYVSSRSVYSWPIPQHGDESAAVVEADPDADATDYAADKRGAELALERELGPERVVHVRAGLILGPRENVGRLPWWLRRIARGGDVLAPGPDDLGIQYVDARDLVRLALDAGAAGRSGPVDTVSPAGGATMGELLRTCVDVTGSPARLVWTPPEFVLAQGIEPWGELPVWMPRDDVELYALHTGDVRRALDWGLRVRPLRETVADTWDWVRTVDGSGDVPEPRPDIGLDPDKEAAALARWRAGESQDSEQPAS
jgi:nucleoside-diphosphate-sugar epimerase